MTVTTLQDAVRQHVRDGQTIALEGFTHLIPFAAGHELAPHLRVTVGLVSHGHAELAQELVDCYNKTGTTIQKRENTHRMAEANKAFSHFA